MRVLASASLAGWLAACGGGGGGGSGGAGGDDSAWLSLTPSPVELTAYSGESQSFTVTARWSKTISEKLNVVVVDRAGVIVPTINIGSSYDAQGTLVAYTAHMKTSPTLATGVHSGSFEVRLCRDTTAACTSPYPGSPWQVPYRITVQSGVDLKALRPLPGAAAWTTHQGNAAHTGYVAATVNPANFSRRFGLAGAPGPVVVDDGRVISVTRASATAGAWTLRGISEATGQPLWNVNMGNLFRVNPPAVAGGQVFVASTGHADSAMWRFEASSGRQLSRVATASQWDSYLAPTVHAGKVYSNSGQYGGLARFDAATGQRDWFLDLAQQDDWTPAVDDSRVYAFTGSTLYSIVPVLGGIAAQLNLDVPSLPGKSTPVLDGAGGLYATQYDGLGRGRLMRVDTARMALSWQLDAQNFRGTPVLAGGTVYVANGTRLEARAPDTGALRWSWNGPSGLTGELVVVGNHAFVGVQGGGGSTEVIDLATHQSVWRYPGTGPMAVSSNGILYISLPEALVAINLH